MKKTAKKLISALLVLAMVVSTFSPAAIAAPATGKSNTVVETTPAADNSVGETADTLLAAATALASIEESSGNAHKISRDEIEEDALLKRADAELKKAGFTEEQNQQLLYFFSEYKKVISGNPDVFGVEAPYFLDKDTNERPIESLLAQVGYTQESLEAAVESGDQTFDEVLGMVQLFYYAAEFGVQMLGDQVKAARDEALSTINNNMTDIEKILALNDWIAGYSQFDWSQLLPIKAPQQGLSELSQQIYPIMYEQIKQQVYEGAKNDLLGNGISEENADIYATAAAESYMEDAAAEGKKNGNTAALEVAGGVYSLWGTMVFGPLALKNAVCIGYSNAFAYLVQSMYPEIYKNSDGTWKTPDQVNVDANGKHENAPYVVDFVRIQFDDTISLFGSPAGSFSSFHFWNALKVNGKWYYVDSCYTDIYVACMLRDRVETDGNMNHVYFMFSHESCENMYDGYYSEIDSLYGNKNNSKMYAGDKTYEDAWFAFAKSPIVREGNYYYYAYDSTDIFDMMSNMGGMGNSRSVSESGNTKAAESNNNNNWGNNWNSGSSWQDSEYKLVRRRVSLKDSTDDFEELINFNEGTVRNLEKGEMEANDLIKTFYAKYQEDAKAYPSLVITTAYYNNVLYFNLSNNVFSYDLKTGAVKRVLEYNKVMGKRDPAKAFGGLAMTTTTNASEAAVTVNNAPIAAIAIKDGNLIVSVATTYGLISGKNPYPPANPKKGDEKKTAMDFYSSYGYFFAETNYNPDYQASKFGYGDETNDNDEFMWSANIIDTISMSHLAGGSHSYKDVTVPESCITDKYTEKRCSTCGKIQDGSDTPMLISESADTKADDEGETQGSTEAPDETTTAPTTEVPDETTTVPTTEAPDETTTAPTTEAPDETTTAPTTEAPDETTTAPTTEAPDETTTAPTTEAPDGTTAPTTEAPDETTTAPTTEAPDETTAPTTEAPKDANVVLTIKIEGKDGKDLGFTTLEAKGKEGETYTFTASQIAEKAKTVSLDGYAVDASTAKEVTDTYKAGTNTKETTVQADRVYADAKVVLTIKIVGKDDTNLGSTTLEKTGKEEETYTFTAEEVAEAAKKVSLDGYTVDASTAKEVTDTYKAGDNKAETTVKADKHVAATLTISIINSATAEDDEPEVLGTVTLTKEGVAGEKATFTADEIKKAAEDAEIGDYTVDTTNKYADTEVEYSKEGTVTVTATKNLHGHGHRYIKFSESYYTRKSGAAADDVRDSAFNKGTCYVCLDCMKAYEEADFTADVRTERDTIYDYQSKLSGKKYAYWTWSSDGTEAALFLIPEELKDIMLDCVWENRLFSTRTEVTPQVTGMKNNCTTGLQLTYTASVTVNGTQYSDSRTITYPEMAHSETLTWTWDLDEEGNVKPLADAQGNLTCAAPSLKLTCNTCGTATDVATKVITQTNQPTCVYPGLTFFMATGKNGERNYADMKMMISAAPLGHDYGDDDFCDRIVDAQGHTCGTERIASTVTLANKTATYTGKAISAPAAKVEGSEGKVTYTYYSDKDCKKALSGAPVEPGVYYVKAKVVAAGDYKAATSKAAKLTINPRSAGTPKVANTSSGIKVSWKKVDEAVGYRVYRKSSSSDSWTRVATITKNSTVSWTNTTKDEKYPIKAGKTYIYTVRAYVNDSCMSSYDTTGVKMKRLSQPSVSVKNVSEGVTISWKKLTGASGYYVYYRTSTKDSWTRIKTIKDASTVSYNYKKANTNGKKYYFTVKAYSGDYQSSFASKTYYRLSKPSISSLKNSSSKKLTVKWSKNSKATGYQFEYATNSKFEKSKTVTVKNVKTLSKTISATKGKTYYVRLRTYKKVDGVNYYSSWSSAKKLKISK